MAEVRDSRNKNWGVGTVGIPEDGFSTNEINVYYAKKPGAKFIKYNYPSAFKKELTTDDENLLIRVREDLKFDKKRRESIAFRYNFCDGGASEKEVGFNGICSEARIRQNVDEAEGAWCTKGTSLCREFCSGSMSYPELENKYNENVFFCYESRLLQTWEAKVGVNEDGTTRNIASDVRNGLAIITSNDRRGDEENRFIFAVFLIRSQKFGDESKNEEGSVSAYDGEKKPYTIVLHRKEAEKMKFWSYYSNPNKGEVLGWSQGLYRYFKHDQAARVLKDIVDIKTDPEEKAEAQELLVLFCKIHGIDINNIPPKSGYLTSIK